MRLDIHKGKVRGNFLAILKINYEGISRGAIYNHEFFHELPIDETGDYYLVVRDSEQTVVSRRIGEFESKPTFSIFDRTKNALPPEPNLFATNSLPEQDYFVAGRLAELTLVLDDPRANPAAAMPPIPWDAYIHVINTDEEVHLLMPGRLNNMQLVNGNFDPNTRLIGHYMPLAYTFETDWQWPEERVGMWHGYPNYVGFIERGRTTNLDWQGNGADPSWLWRYGPQRLNRAPLSAPDSAPTSRYSGTPVIVDLDGDGSLEVIIGNGMQKQVEVYDVQGNIKVGWPRHLGGTVNTAVSVADLDGDGLQEVIVGSSDGFLHALHVAQNRSEDWHVRVGVEAGVYYRFLATPAVADLDGDGSPDIVVPLADGRLYAYEADGTLKAGWPVSIGEIADSFGGQIGNSSPVIADLDGDGDVEIVVGSYDKQVYLFDHSGQLQTGWPFATDDVVVSTPVVADIDPDSDGLEVVIASGDSYLYVLDGMGELLWQRATGWTVRSSPVVGDMNGDGAPEILLGSDDDQVWAWHHNGDLVDGWPQATTADVVSSPRLGDIDGDGAVDVVVGSHDGYVYAWHQDGSPVDGWPLATTASVVGAPALANLDGDEALEIVVGDFNGELFFWQVDRYSAALPLIFK